MSEVNLVPVLLCGVASMLLGGIWYSPMLFGKAWQRGAGLSDEQLAAGNLGMIYGLAFLLSLAAAFAFGLFLAHVHTAIGPWRGAGAGAAAGLGFVATSFGINYLFERKSAGLGLINGGYHVLQFTSFGLIFGLLG
jgi:hypothetical protein